MKEPIYSELTSNSSRECVVKKRFPEFHSYLLDRYKDITFSEALYWYFNNVTEMPKCICGKPLKFINSRLGYTQHCSKACSNSDENKKQKTKEVNQKRYGGVAPACSEEVRNKSKQTCLERYGVDNGMKDETIKKKSHSTIIERYGGFGNQVKRLREKYKQTNFDKYGATNHSQSKEYQDRLKQRRPDILDINYQEHTYLCRCCDDKCNKCTEKTYTIPWSTYQNRCIFDPKHKCTIKYPIREPNSQGTHIELFIRDILNRNHIEYKTNVRDVIAPYELDIYIPLKMIAIECNGVYFHSSEMKERNYHNKKYKLCQEQGIQLISIWEDQVINTSEKIESLILSKLGIYELRVGARKCIIKEVLSKEANDFLDKYHLQGGNQAKVRYGLYYEGDLVSVMTFSWKRNKLIGKGDWELVRYGCKKGIQVIGGFEKLLKHFIDLFQPSSIYSFSSNDISNGDVYKKCGFVKTTEDIGYWYISSKLVRYHRASFTKDSIIKLGWRDTKEGWTESQVMKEKGFLKIYDSGQTKWVYNSDQNTN